MIPVEEGLHTEASTCKRQDGGHRQRGWRGRWGEDGPAEGSEAALMEPTCPHLTKSCKRGQKRQRVDRGTYLNWTSSYKGGRQRLTTSRAGAATNTNTNTKSQDPETPSSTPLLSPHPGGPPGPSRRGASHSPELRLGDPVAERERGDVSR